MQTVDSSLDLSRSSMTLVFFIFKTKKVSDFYVIKGGTNFKIEITLVRGSANKDSHICVRRGWNDFSFIQKAKDK